MAEFWAFNKGGEAGVRVFREDLPNENPDPSTGTHPVNDYGAMLFDSLNSSQLLVSSVGLVDVDALIASANGAQNAGPYTAMIPSGEAGLTIYTANSFWAHRVYVETPLNDRLVLAFPVDENGWVGSTLTTRFLTFQSAFLRRDYGSVTVASGLPNATNLGAIKKSTGWGVPAQPHAGKWSGPTMKKVFLIVLKLQANDTPVTFESGPGVTGGHYIDTTDGVKIAKSGWTVQDGSDKLIVGGDDHAALVAATGEVTVAGGATVQIALPDDVDYGPETVAMIMGKQAGNTIWQQPPSISWPDLYNAALDGAVSRVVNGVLEIKNPTPYALDLRYTVFADDARDPVTTVGLQTLIGEHVSSSGEKYYQIRRVGSTTPPRVSDVLLDTRMSYMPIIAKGVLDLNPPGGDAVTPTAGELYTVTLPETANGWFPFVLISMGKRFKNLSIDRIDWSGLSSPVMEYHLASNNDMVRTPTSESVLASIYNDRVTFQLWQQHPYRMEWNINGSNATLQRYYYPQTAILRLRYEKMRYYIIAIPANLNAGQ